MNAEKIKWKRGDVHPVTGLIFWAYYKHLPNGEYWLDEKKYKLKHLKSLDKAKRWRSDNSIKCKEYHKKRYEEFPEKVKRISKRWRDENQEKVREHRRLYEKNKRIKDPIHSLKRRLRCRTAKAFIRNGYSKKSQTESMLGCEWLVLKNHIESKFTDGMSWGNRHLWHIDHIVPLASATTLDELMKLCHYTNLQPLWAFDNQSKGAKLNLKSDVI